MEAGRTVIPGDYESLTRGLNKNVLIIQHEKMIRFALDVQMLSWKWSKIGLKRGQYFAVVVIQLPAYTCTDVQMKGNFPGAVFGTFRKGVNWTKLWLGGKGKYRCLEFINEEKSEFAKCWSLFHFVVGQYSDTQFLFKND